MSSLTYHMKFPWVSKFSPSSYSVTLSEETSPRGIGVLRSPVANLMLPEGEIIRELLFSSSKIDRMSSYINIYNMHYTSVCLKDYLVTERQND